ncbi:hypothetical protein BGX29_001586 [Mortierella sp. GBA35]|nr:hypothetical protein BGX29_001586 [Mortierella sp. GBA35]
MSCNTRQVKDKYDESKDAHHFGKQRDGKSRLCLTGEPFTAEVGKGEAGDLRLFKKAILQWGDAVPVMFIENRALWDFEFVVREHEDCDNSGCVLASAFFPGGGQQQLTIYPTMFDAQSENDQDKIGEGGWRSEVFGSEDPFTIMNYGEKCKLTDTDKKDFKLLYAMAWSRALTEINGTPIVLFKPFSAHAPLPKRKNEP